MEQDLSCLVDGGGTGVANDKNKYALGVDLGTTYTAAAVRRDGVSRMLALGADRPAMPSVVSLTNGDVLVGDAAERRSVSHPQDIARQFKRRIGDSTPSIVGGAPWSAEALTGRLLRHVLDVATSLEGQPPDSVVLTHPANWHEFKIDRLRQAALVAGLESVDLVAEPVAAAQYYASQGRVDAGQKIAIFDLGGGTFDAAVVGLGSGGFELIGRPNGLEQLGGSDLDQAVFAHVLNAVGSDLSELEDSKENRSAVARLRDDCRKAKEHLSVDTSVSIPVMLPGRHTEVRLNRTEFEAMIELPLSDAMSVLTVTIREAGLTPEELDGVLLVGGSSRIPLVTQLLARELGLPVLADAHPKHTVALGACVEPETMRLAAATDEALIAEAGPDAADGDDHASPQEAAVAAPVVIPVEDRDLDKVDEGSAPEPAVSEGADRDEAESDDDGTRTAADGSRTSSRRKLVGASVMLLAVLAVGLGLSRAGSDPDGSVAAVGISPSDENNSEASDGVPGEGSDDRVSSTLDSGGEGIDPLGPLVVDAEIDGRSAEVAPGPSSSAGNSSGGSDVTASQADTSTTFRSVTTTTTVTATTRPPSTTSRSTSTSTIRVTPTVTAAPVTAAPVTAAPVTAAPVTAAPVTAAPVSVSLAGVPGSVTCGSQAYNISAPTTGTITNYNWDTGRIHLASAWNSGPGATVVFDLVPGTYSITIYVNSKSASKTARVTVNDDGNGCQGMRT